MARRVHQQVLRLDVPVAHARRVVQVRQRPAGLIHVELDQQRGHPLPPLCIVLGDAVDRFGDELEHQVQIDLVAGRGRVEAVAQADDVWVPDHLHHRQLAVLEPAVLEDFLDGDGLPRLEAGRLEDDAEGAVADDAGGGEGEGRARWRRWGSCCSGRRGRRRRRRRRGGGVAAVARRSCCSPCSSPEAPEGGNGGRPDDVGARGRVALDDAALVGLFFFLGGGGERVRREKEKEEKGKEEKKVRVFFCPGGRFFFFLSLDDAISLETILSKKNKTHQLLPVGAPRVVAEAQVLEALLVVGREFGCVE